MGSSQKRVPMTSSEMMTMQPAFAPYNTDGLSSCTPLTSTRNAMRLITMITALIAAQAGRVRGKKTAERVRGEHRKEGRITGLADSAVRACVLYA